MIDITAELKIVRSKFEKITEELKKIDFKQDDALVGVYDALDTVFQVLEECKDKKIRLTENELTTLKGVFKPIPVETMHGWGRYHIFKLTQLIEVADQLSKEQQTSLLKSINDNLAIIIQDPAPRQRAEEIWNLLDRHSNTLARLLNNESSFTNFYTPSVHTMFYFFDILTSSRGVNAQLLYDVVGKVNFDTIMGLLETGHKNNKCPSLDKSEKEQIFNENRFFQIMAGVCKKKVEYSSMIDKETRRGRTEVLRFAPRGLSGP